MLNIYKMLIAGGRRGKKTSLKYRKRGGAGLMPSPVDNGGVPAYPPGGTTNNANIPTMPPKSTMVGGMGYGYASGADAAIFGGNYFPVQPTCTQAVDPSRGGNKFMSGGTRRRSKRSRTKRSRTKRSRTKRSSTKRSSTKQEKRLD
jgi:hypothetical protein